MHGCSQPKVVSYTSCYNCSTDTFSGITIGEFKYGIARYRTTHFDSINNEPYMANLGLKDARACWYSLNTLKKFICLIEKYSGQLVSNTDSLDLGIRFYYAVYPDSSTPRIDHFDIADKSRHTLFLVPTYFSSADSLNIDFDPRYSVSPLNFAIYSGDSASAFALGYAPRSFTPGSSGSSNNSNSTNGGNQNQGQLCPPTCPNNVTSTMNTIDNLLTSVGYTTKDN